MTEEAKIKEDNPIVWKPTCRLRWKYKEMPFDMINIQRVLQQMWVGDGEEQEWRDIEIIE